MTLKYSVDKLLYQRQSSDCFWANLQPDENTLTQMNEIKMLVRKTIRNAFKAFQEKVEEKGLSALTEEYGISLESLATTGNIDDAINALKKVKPKFCSQGSSVYKTLNKPAHTPPQQMDVDDGAYLPMTIIEETGPIIAKEAFFKIVDSALQQLCQENREWKFINNKATCARIIVSTDMHIDVPLYAIPEGEYAALTEAHDSLSYSLEALATKAQEVILDPDQVYLAMRNEEHWKQSDPREISEWFKSEVKLHGEGLRRVCRYLKAWRDHTWEDGGGPSSISLMACAVNTYNEPQNSNGFAGDSEALLAVVTALPTQLSEGVYLMTKNEMLYPRESDQKNHSEIVSQAEKLKINIRRSLLSAESQEECVSGFMAIFGLRFPYDVERVESIASQVRSTSAMAQPSPKTEMKPNFSAG